MQKWQNVMIGPLAETDMRGQLEGLGKDGFEPVSLTSVGGWYVALLKRPLVEREPVVEEKGVQTQQRAKLGSRPDERAKRGGRQRVTEES